MRFTGLATVVVLAALVLAGCGDPEISGASSGATDPTRAGSTAPAGSSDPTKPAEERCPYLAAEQVAAALATPMTETAGSVHACFFDPDGGTGPSVLLSRVDIQIDPTDYATQSRALCQGEVTDVAVGDEAFACMSGMGPQGQMYTHRVLISINVNGAADDAAGVADAADLLMLVTVPPSTD
jgi:hypothetical protein